MKKKPAAPPGSTGLLRNPRRVFRTVLIVTAYLFAFIIADFITKQYVELPGIVAWYPPAGLTYTLLLVFGVTYTPAVTIALLFSSLFVYRMPQPPYALFLWAFIISLVYSAAAAFLRERIRFDWRLRKLRDVTWFVLTTVLVSALLAVLSVSSSALSSDMPRSEVLSSIFHWWIGETVGVLTITPFLLIYVMPGLKRFADGQPVRLPAHWSFPRPTLSVIGQASCIVFTLYWVFGAPVLNEYKPLFLITLPLIWVALQRGFKGVTAAIVMLNSGVVLVLWFSRFDLARLEELQLLVIVNCIVYLFTGAVVTERKQAEQEIVSLARFPSESPNPVLRLNQDGIVMYANAASDALLGLWGCRVDGSAPQIWRDWVTQVLASVENKIIDIECDGRVYSMFVTPVAEMGYVDLYGRDITERKQREEELRSRTEELTTLYQLSRALADANDLEKVFELVTRHALGSVRATFAFIALLEEDDLVPRTVYPIRKMEHDFTIGDRQPISALPSCQRVLNKNEPVILQSGSPEVGSAERAILLLDFVQSVCVVPLWVGDPSQHLSQALGLLILGEAREEKRESFTPEKIHLARSIGDQAASAIRRLLLREQAGRRLTHLASLSEIDRTIASNFDLGVTLPMILKHVSEQLEVDAADVLVFDDHMQTLQFAAGRGFHSRIIERTRLRLGESLAGQAALERHIIQIQDITASGTVLAQSELMKAEQAVAYFAVPLITKGQLKGVLEIYQRTPLTPNEEWLDFLSTLAGQVAIAIENTHLFENLQRSNIELGLAYDATIEGWSHALDLRDKETEGHTLRVAEMTVNLARTFGLSEGELVQVRWGGLMHDIGKMGVPDGILLKPGPLTDEEWGVMKRHPLFAFEMLSPIRYLRAALDIPYCHHEKWDGTGYPRGLKGEQIPLTARIFAVVDVWDALTSDRPYRKAWSKEKTIEHIKSVSGTHFDPQVVNIFLLEHDEKGSSAL